MADSPTIIDAEEWRESESCPGLWVSNLGRVWRAEVVHQRNVKGVMQTVRRKAHLCAPFLTAGYPSIGYRKTKFYVHQLVCEAFHGPRPEGCDVAHGDGDPLNNSAENLRWASRKENIHDQMRHGTKPYGNQLSFTKVPDEALDAIRAGNVETDREFARRFNCSARHISAIRKGRERVPMEITDDQDSH